MRGLALFILISSACGENAAPAGSPDAGTETFSGTTTVLASGIQFMPATMKSDEALHTSLAIDGIHLFFSDATELPVKDLLPGSGAISALAYRAGRPQRIAVSASSLFWTDGSRLFRTALDGSATSLIATGNLEAGPALLADGDSVVWIRTVATPECSPACVRQVERVSAAGAITTLAETRRPVSALAQDDSFLYWEEEGSLEQVSPGCNCGSSIKRMARSGGQPAVVADGTLNGSLPSAPRGFLAASWIPAGGIGVDGTSVVFARQTASGHELITVPAGGGAVATLARLTAVPTAIAAAGGVAWWIDATSASSVPLAGGDVTALATGVRPSAIQVVDNSLLVADLGPISGCCSRPGAGRILSIPLTGGPATALVTGLDAPSSLQAAAARLYWAEPWRVGKAPVVGGSPATLAGGISSRLPRLVVSGGALLVLDGPFVKSLPRAGGHLEKVATATLLDDLSVAADDLAADDAAVYVSTMTIAGVRAVTRFPRNGGAPATVVPPGPGHPIECAHRLALDARQVYWTAASPTSPVDCAIFAAPLSGGAAVVVADASMRDFALSGSDVFFSSASRTVTDESGSRVAGLEGLARVSTAGGAVTSYPTPGFPSLLAVDGARAYWISPPGISPPGIVASATLSGGGYTTLASGGFFELENLLDTMVAASGSVYWTDFTAGTISRFTPAGR